MEQNFAIQVKSFHTFFVLSKCFRQIYPKADNCFVSACAQSFEQPFRKLGAMFNQPHPCFHRPITRQRVNVCILYILCINLFSMFPSKHFADFLSSIITYSAYERYKVKNIDFELEGGGLRYQLIKKRVKL